MELNEKIPVEDKRIKEILDAVDKHTNVFPLLVDAVLMGGCEMTFKAVDGNLLDCVITKNGEEVFTCTGLRGYEQNLAANTLRALVSTSLGKLITP